MRLLSSVRRSRRRYLVLRGGHVRLMLGSALVAMLLVSVIVPATRPGRASAAECPPGYVLEGGGLLAHCVPLLSPDDLGIGDGQIVDDNGGIEAGGPPPQLTPVVIDIDPDDDPPVVIDVEPQDQDIDLTDVPVLLTNDGYVSLAVHQCPDGFDAYTADYFELAYNCSAAHSGVEFLAVDGNDELFRHWTNQFGNVEFSYLAPGWLNVVEEVPAGFGEPVAYCTSFRIVNNQAIETDLGRMDTTGDQIHSYILEAGESLYCDWYSVPSNDGTGQLEPVEVIQLTPVVGGQLTPVVYEPTATPIP